jgi:Na+/melibiose symporter-like transporter
VTGFPGALLGPVPFLIVPWFRRKFQSRTLYILSEYLGQLLNVPVFLIGTIGGKKHGLYKNRLVMTIVLTFYETITAFFYGMRKVIPSEMYNETMDYCEWKNGYRTEAMTSVAKGLATKLAGIFTNILTLQIKRWINYDQTAYIRGKAQTDDTKYWLFASYSILPLLTGFLGIIPMLFYDLSGAKRERMYAELLEHRAKISKSVSNAEAETMEKIAKEQFELAERNKNKKL